MPDQSQPMQRGPEVRPVKTRDPIKDVAILDALGKGLAAKRAKAIEARANQGIDQRWFEDVEAYEGRDEQTRQYPGLRATVQGYVASQNDAKKAKRSMLIVNVTRSKVNASSARLAEIALPTDDRNWDIRHSTQPELVENMSKKHLGLVLNGKPIMVNDNGQQRQATLADHAKMDMEKAKARAIAMRDEIDDQLDMSADGCGYEGVVRSIIDDHELLGVGIGKGPVVTSRTKKVWMPITNGETIVHVLQRIQDLKPSSSRVNPWDIYPHPDCGEHPTKMPIWERIPGVTAKDIRGYADIPGYLAEQIKKVLIQGPKKPEQPADKPGEHYATTDDTVFEAWEYHGDIDREELEAAGCECKGDDVFTSYSSSVIMINDTVIKADIEILDTGDMPYDFYCTNRCSGSWAGYGTSFIARSAQKAITAGWRAMMDNAGQYIGPQIVMNRKHMAPATGDYEMRGMKLWFYTGADDAADMGKMFAVHEISAHQAEYAAIIKMGMEFLDNETAIPQLAQGEQGDATDVLGGMQILVNMHNVTVKRKLKALDDQFTIRHIGRYVDWNMQYNKKPEIKGDFEVVARASGALMDMEIQNKAAGNLLGLASNPAYAHGMKKWDAVRRVVRSFRFDPDDFVKDDDEIKQIEDKMAKEAPQADPRIEVAKIRAEADQKIAAMQQQFDTAENEKDRQNKIAIEMINERMTSTELTSVERQVLEKIKAELAKTALTLQTQVRLSNNDQMLDLHKHTSGQALDLHKHASSQVVDLHKHSTPQVAKAVAEPAGRAPNGKGFTQ